MSNMERFKYIIVVDVDEFIIPSNVKICEYLWINSFETLKLIWCIPKVTPLVFSCVLCNLNTNYSKECE